MSSRSHTASRRASVVCYLLGDVCMSLTKSSPILIIWLCACTAQTTDFDSESISKCTGAGIEPTYLCERPTAVSMQSGAGQRLDFENSILPVVKQIVARVEPAALTKNGSVAFYDYETNTQKNESLGTITQHVTTQVAAAERRGGKWYTRLVIVNDGTWRLAVGLGTCVEDGPPRDDGSKRYLCSGLLLVQGTYSGKGDNITVKLLDTPDSCDVVGGYRSC